MVSMLREASLQRIIAALFISALLIMPVIRADVDQNEYYPYGGGLVHGQILGFNWYDELIPVVWADITFLQDGEFITRTYSGGGGYYEVILPVGHYTLMVEERGYKTFSRDIFVSSGSSSTINIYLYLDYEYYEKEKEVSEYTAILTIIGLPSNLSVNLSVDGEPKGVIQGGGLRELVFPEGTSHIIEVEKIVDGLHIRYVVDENTWTVSSESSHTFTYDIEFYVTFKTEPEGIKVLSMEGWYPEGETIRTGKASEIIEVSSDTRLVFDSWLVDGGVVEGDSIVITVNSPLTIELKYTIEYFVEVSSNIGEPKGTGWYREGESAEISVPNSVGILIRKVFDGWSGDYAGPTSPARIIVEKPMVIKASWRDDYTPLIILLGSLGGIIVLAGILIYLFKGGGRSSS